MWYSPKTLEALCRCLDREEVGIFPCDTVWGLIGRPTLRVIRQLTLLKQRPETQPFLFLLPDFSALKSIAVPVFQALMAAHSPGPVTFILPRASQLDKGLVGGGETVAVRLPDYFPLTQLLSRCDGPLLSTSCNLHGQAAALSYDEIPASIRSGVDFEFTAMRPLLNVESTIIDLSGAEPSVIRRGCDDAILAEIGLANADDLA